MKRLEIDLMAFVNIPLAETKDYVENKLKEAGFDLSNRIKSSVDSVNLQYIYEQEEERE